MAMNKKLEIWWERFFIIFFIVLISVFTAGVVFTYSHQDTIFPGVGVGSFPLGGLTIEEAEQTLRSSLDKLNDTGLLFVYHGRKVVVPTVMTSTADPDLSYEVITHDLPAILLQAYAFGRDGSFLENWQNRLTSLFSKKEINPIYIWRRDKVLEILHQNFVEFEDPAQDVKLEIKDGNIFLTKEQEGHAFDYRLAVMQAEEQLNSLLFAPIIVELRKDLPRVGMEKAQTLLPKIREIILGGPITVRYGDLRWDFSRGQINDLLEIRAKDSGSAEPIVGLAKDKLAVLLEQITKEINQEVQEPKFNLEGSRVVEFQAGRDGRKLRFEDNWRSWEAAVLNNQTELELAVETVKPQQVIGDLNDLGIKEILGTGTSNFAGSPQNRRHNIAVGASALNGLLVAPGEEFSLLKALGNINSAAGYLPELVIKGNKTVPEYGGGLCQIGTTIFRATLASGLPVTARRSHSYQVSYYNDVKGLPGKDATIYNPAPDYKFKNDAADYVLIQTRIEGDNLIFEFWGTPDGRAAVQSDVKVWDRVSPGPTKFIETLDLPVGKKRCTESAHAGIKAEFDYKITYADGRTDEQTFFSQYRPWQAVCLIGVEKLSEETEDGLEIQGADVSVTGVE